MSALALASGPSSPAPPPQRTFRPLTRRITRLPGRGRCPRRPFERQPGRSSRRLPRPPRSLAPASPGGAEESPQLLAVSPPPPWLPLRLARCAQLRALIGLLSRQSERGRVDVTLSAFARGGVRRRRLRAEFGKRRRWAVRRQQSWEVSVRVPTASGPPQSPPPAHRCTPSSCSPAFYPPTPSNAEPGRCVMGLRSGALRLAAAAARAEVRRCPAPRAPARPGPC